MKMNQQLIPNTLRRFFNDVCGATLVEYGVALLIVVIVGSAAVTGLATAVGDELGETASAF